MNWSYFYTEFKKFSVNDVYKSNLDPCLKTEFDIILSKTDDLFSFAVEDIFIYDKLNSYENQVKDMIQVQREVIEDYCSNLLNFSPEWKKYLKDVKINWVSIYDLDIKKLTEILRKCKEKK